jgi:hypothetical protein
MNPTTLLHGLSIALVLLAIVSIPTALVCRHIGRNTNNPQAIKYSTQLIWVSLIDLAISGIIIHNIT